MGCGDRHGECTAVGQADVLTGEDDHPPGDEPGILAGLEHPGQPVDRGVGVGTPHRLDERAHDVVVIVAAVAECTRAERLFDVMEFDMPVAAERTRHLERGQHLPAIAAGALDQQVDRVVISRHGFGPETPIDELADRCPIERFETEQGGTTAQRGVDLEEGVLGGGADQGQRPVLDRRQQGILLRLREPVDLVEEQDRSLSPLAESVAGTLDRGTHVLDAGVHRRHLLERPRRAAGDRQRERRLARPGRAPQQDRRQPVGLDEDAQWPAGSDEVILADDVVDRARAQSGSKRSAAAAQLLPRGREQVVSHGRDRRARARRPGDGTRRPGR